MCILQALESLPGLSRQALSHPPGDPRSRASVASRALHLQSLQRGDWLQALLRAQWLGLLPQGLPPSVFSTLCLLCGSHPGRESTPSPCFPVVVTHSWRTRVTALHSLVWNQGRGWQLCSILACLPVFLFQRVLTAMDQTWHPEHFFCSHCGEVFGAEGTAGVPWPAFLDLPWLSGFLHYHPRAHLSARCHPPLPFPNI